MRTWYINRTINKSFTYLFVIYPYFSPDDLNTLSIISEKYCVKKSPERAFGFREQGNLSFKVKDYTTAALFYSEVRNLAKLI